MTFVRPQVYKAIESNDLNAVLFKDPFGPATRAAKRNLVVASFIALLIALLGLEIVGFLGLRTSNQDLGNQLAQGIACCVVLYFLVSFIFQCFIDYSAWSFEQERQLTQPYLELIKMFESHVHVTGEQIKNACAILAGVIIENDMPAQIEARKLIDSAHGQLRSIQDHIDSIRAETKPLLSHWASTIKRMTHLDARLRMRFLSLWLIDILFPLAFAALALLSTFDGVADVIARIAGE